jgi:xylan 1,4-beta-xylosidase
MSFTRRFTLGTLFGGGAAFGGAALAKPAAPACAAPHAANWARGIEGQRKADLGDGTFLNPIVPGDHPDPSILKDGEDYYLVFSTFDAYPALTVWHSRDLVNWAPISTAVTTPIGSFWAPEICKHGDTFYIYAHARTPAYRSIYVVTTKDPRSRWSEPVDLKLTKHIDPGHVVGEDGKRYLFLSGGDRVKLSDDGLSTDGAVSHVYDPWHYPQDWVVESFSPEGPKILRHGEYFYMLLAVGGTAGPPTGHMVIAARSRSVHGPWENAPNNPIVRTESASEKWWSRGHATPVEGPDGSWWLIYHGYENGFWTLGRQPLLDPMRWTKDGWFEAVGGDLSRPLRGPRGGKPSPSGVACSDDFRSNRFGTTWSFYDPGPTEMSRVRYEDAAMVVKAKGAQPFDCSPLSFLAGDQAYEVEVDIEISGGAQAGILLFYNKRLYCGLGYNAGGFVMHRYGLERNRGDPKLRGSRVRMRIANDRHIVTIHISQDSGKSWQKFGVQMEVSGYHHNVAYDFLSLRPALYVAGTGEARFRNLVYNALP